MGTRYLGSRGLSPERDASPWQQRGRCGECGTKVAAARRVRTCVCGGKVRY